MTINIIGLGPGDGRFVTREAWEILTNAETIYLRTEHHPVRNDLPSGVNIKSFDYIYESARDFEEVYHRISHEIIKLGKEGSFSKYNVEYCVPGHPLIGEATVIKILEEAKKEGLEVKIVAGLSFIEPTLAVLQIDGLEGLQLFDALEITKYYHPPLSTEHPLLVGQVYNRLVAGELKISLSALYPDVHEVVLVHAAGTGNQSMEQIPLFELDRSELIGHLTSLYIPPMTKVNTLPGFAETVAFLRGPNGCPWDQDQTHKSLRSGLIEETGEVLAAIEADDPDALCEEIGDLLYHLVLQAQIAQEHGEFGLGDVIAGIDAKLKRRHPHVWGDMEFADSDEVIKNWEMLKAEERSNSGDQSILDNISIGLTALMRAQKIQDKVAGVGFDWPTIEEIYEKLAEETAELRAAKSTSEQLWELGDILFVLVNLTRRLGFDAEIVLRDANKRFENRFRKLEILGKKQQLDLTKLNLDGLNQLWEKAKITNAQ